MTVAEITTFQIKKLFTPISYDSVIASAFGVCLKRKANMREIKLIYNLAKSLDKNIKF